MENNTSELKVRKDKNVELNLAILCLGVLLVAISGLGLLYIENQKLEAKVEDMYVSIQQQGTKFQSEFNSVNYKLGELEKSKFSGEIEFLENSTMEELYDADYGWYTIYNVKVKLKAAHKGIMLVIVEIYDTSFDTTSYQTIVVKDGVGLMYLDDYETPDNVYTVLGTIILK
jgi:hypothetical protein